MSRDFELGRKLTCTSPVWLAGGVDRQSHTGLIFITPPPIGGRGIVFARFLCYPPPIGRRGIVFARFLCLFIYLFLCLFVSFFVFLSARLRENGWTDLREIFREGVEWPWDDLITFWVNSGKPRDVTMLGSGVCCAAHHGLFIYLLKDRRKNMGRQNFERLSSKVSCYLYDVMDV